MGVIALSAAHAAALAVIHAEAFSIGDQWNEAAFAGLLESPGVCGWLDEAGGFILARKAGGEAEVLSLAVAPPARRRGVARRLLRMCLDGLRCPVFLEVGTRNHAALGLYLSSGFAGCGKRQGYYGPGEDALVLRYRPGEDLFPPDRDGGRAVWVVDHG